MPAARAAAPIPAAAAAVAGAAASRWPAGRRRLLPGGALEPRVTAAGAARAHRVAGAQRGPRAAGHSGRAGAVAAPAGAHRAVVSTTPLAVSGLLPRRQVHTALCLLSWYRAGRPDPRASSASCTPLGRPDPQVLCACLPWARIGGTLSLPAGLFRMGQATVLPAGPPLGQIQDHTQCRPFCLGQTS